MPSSDHRIRHTHQRLFQALRTLIAEHGYDAVTVQQIVERAEVGRTTFYAHFNNKEELVAAAHQAEVAALFAAGDNPLYTRAELLAPEPPPRLIALFEIHARQRAALRDVLHFGKDAPAVEHLLRDHVVQHLEGSLHAAFDAAASPIPFDVLAQYLAGAQMSFIAWWLHKRPQAEPATMAAHHHRIQRAVLLDLFPPTRN